MREQIIKIAEDLKNKTITEEEAHGLLLCLFDVMSMLPPDEEIKKHAEYSTDFWHRNGRDMSVPREYFCAGADWVRCYFRTKKGDVTGDYS
jgi:hypothetical protein